MSSFTPTHDIPIIISSPLTSSERRITPSWTLSQLKQKLEFVTGIPPSAQRLEWKAPGTASGAEGAWMEDGGREIGSWGLVKGGEIEVHDLRPPQLRSSITASEDEVEKYTLPSTIYESLPNTVLNWKKTQKLGRFDPNNKSAEQVASERLEKDTSDLEERGIVVEERCEVGSDDNRGSSSRRGVVRFVGAIPELPTGGLWVGVELDEPVGKNDGSVKGRRVFEIRGEGGLRGVFVRPERVTVGDFPPFEDFEEELEELGEEMEEI